MSHSSSCPLPPPVLQQGISLRCPSTPQLGAEGANDPLPSSSREDREGVSCWRCLGDPAATRSWHRPEPPPRAASPGTSRARRRAPIGLLFRDTEAQRRQGAVSPAAARRELCRNYRSATPPLPTAFNETIEKDNSLAVGYFQRGFVHLQLEMYEEALSDYHMAFSHLRQNPFIDYKQLGLRHILYAWEVLYSTAAVQCHLQQWQEARVTLEKAVVWRPERRAAVLELALERVQDHLFLEPMLVPLGELFRPRKKEVEQLDSKDFLGKPKVISSIIPNDEYIGFEPLRPQNQGFYQPSADALRDAESGYHRVLSPYRPPAPAGAELPAGSLLFVLSRAADGWATAIHDGQKLHIPSSLLEPASRMDTWKINTGIPLPPAQVPPSCLHVKQKPDPPGEENASANDANAHTDSKVPPGRGQAAGRPAVLRLRCECSLVLRAGRAPALPALRALLRDRLAELAQRGTLSYRLVDGTELGTVSGQEDLGKVWQQLTDGRLTLCCQDSDSHLGRPVLYQMLAQHSYLAQGPGDLEFSKGDVLDVLSEVNKDWLEGRCNGKTGIFPKCFATQTSCDAAFL